MLPMKQKSLLTRFIVCLADTQTSFPLVLVVLPICLLAVALAFIWRLCKRLAKQKKQRHCISNIVGNTSKYVWTYFFWLVLRTIINAAFRKPINFLEHKKEPKEIDATKNICRYVNEHLNLNSVDSCGRQTNHLSWFLILETGFRSFVDFLGI